MSLYFIFFFNDTATTEIYTLSLHDALPISCRTSASFITGGATTTKPPRSGSSGPARSEEHTSELQSRPHLVCRLLLEKKKNKNRRARAIHHPHRLLRRDLAYHGHTVSRLTA